MATLPDSSLENQDQSEHRFGDRALAGPRTQNEGNGDRRRPVATTAPDLTGDRMAARKMAEQKAKARTLARAQAVAEKLSTATEQVSSAVQEASGAIHELEKTMQQVSTGSQQASAAAEESRTAINQIEKASDQAQKNVATSLQRVNALQAQCRVALKTGRFVALKAGHFFIRVFFRPEAGLGDVPFFEVFLPIC